MGGAASVSGWLRQKGRMPFDLGGPWALLFSKAPHPRSIRHIKIHPLCILNELYIATQQGRLVAKTVDIMLPFVDI